MSQQLQILLHKRKINSVILVDVLYLKVAVSSQ